ncbi:MAG: antitoxin VbhA family protein [Faecalibacterium sp.]
MEQNKEKLKQSVLDPTISANMDALSPAQKQNSLDFADAMNSIEGLPISDEMRVDLDAWQVGELSFSDVVQNTLRRHGFLKD